jgi:hypothetical protein
MLLLLLLAVVFDRVREGFEKREMELICLDDREEKEDGADVVVVDVDDDSVLCCEKLRRS